MAKTVEHGKYDVDFMQLLYENDNISIYQLDAIHLGVNRNGMSIDRECVTESLPSFADMPLYCVIDNEYDPLNGARNDFLEHFREEYPDRITRDRVLPFGTVPESAISKAKIVERDGKEYLRIQVVIWKRLLPHVSDILQRRDGSVKVSVEFTLDKFHRDEDTGIVHIHKFTITAITALGSKFQEVMDGSMLKSVKFSFGEYVEDCKNNYCLFASQDEVDVPDDVLCAIKDGISMRERYGRGSSIESYRNMCAVVESGKIYNSQIVDMNSYFSVLKDIPEDTTTKTNKYIEYNMFGGEVGRQWAESVCNSLDADVINNSERRNAEMDESVNNAQNKMSIDNTKESAVHSKEWSNPGKKLYEPLFEASNVNSLIYEAYLIAEDGFQDAPSEKLKYPHHVVRDGVLILDVAGVQAALSRAKQEDIFEGQVYDHLKRHYKELELNMDLFDEKNAVEVESVENSLDTNDDIDYKVVVPDDDAEVEDDADDEVEDFAEKCARLERENAEITAKLAEFTRKEDIKSAKMSIEEFSHCFDETVMHELMAKADELDKDSMNAMLCSKVMEFAKGLKCNAVDTEKADMPEVHLNAYFNHSKESSFKTSSEIDGVIKRQKTRVI